MTRRQLKDLIDPLALIVLELDEGELDLEAELTDEQRAAVLRMAAALYVACDQ